MDRTDQVSAVKVLYGWFTRSSSRDVVSC